MGDAQTGRVVFYAPAKCFGFIKRDGDEPGHDVFFHMSQFNGSPTIGTRVSFHLEDDPRRNGRTRAKSITPV